MSEDAGLGSIIPAYQLDKLSEPCDCLMTQLIKPFLTGLPW